MKVAFNAFVPTPAGKFGWVIRRTQQAARRAVRIAIGHLEIVDDLALVPNVIARGKHVDAEFEEFLGDLSGDAEAGS